MVSAYQSTRCNFQQQLQSTQNCCENLKSRSLIQSTAGAICTSLQIFSTPYHHPKSQPFIDHVITFSVLDSRIWFRNFQILSEDGALAEIGPRFVLNPIKIFDGSFQGQTIWENPRYVSPALVIYTPCYLILGIEKFVYDVHIPGNLIVLLSSTNTMRSSHKQVLS